MLTKAQQEALERRQETAGELVRAAERMRELAEAAVPSPWRWGDWTAMFGTPEVHRTTLEHSPAQDPFPAGARRSCKETTAVLCLEDWLDERSQSLASGMHIMSWHPDVALAVAGWLDEEASALLESATSSSGQAALAVARAFMTTAPGEPS